MFFLYGCRTLRDEILQIFAISNANIRLILEKADISWQIIPLQKILRIFPDNPICSPHLYDFAQNFRDS